MTPTRDDHAPHPEAPPRGAMQLGISGFAWTGTVGQADVPLLASARALGFAAFEVPMFSPADLPVAALRAGLAANDLACTVCAILPPGINPISPDPAARRQAHDHLSACVHAAAEMGAHLLGGPVVAPIGYLPGHRPTADEWTWAAEACHSVTPLLDSYRMTLSLEPVNRSETFFLRTAADATRLCSQLGHARVGVTVDTFHANIEETCIADAITETGPYLRHMHLSENDRGPLGRGHIDFSAILQALLALNYHGLLVVEGFGFDAGKPQAPGYLWADPRVTPEHLASSGLDLLKRWVG